MSSRLGRFKGKSFARYALHCRSGWNVVHLGGLSHEQRDVEFRKFKSLLQEYDNLQNKLNNEYFELPRSNRCWSESYVRSFLTFHAMTLCAVHLKLCCIKNEMVRKAIGL